MPPFSPFSLKRPSLDIFPSAFGGNRCRRRSSLKAKRRRRASSGKAGETRILVVSLPEIGGHAPGRCLRRPGLAAEGARARQSGRRGPLGMGLLHSLGRCTEQGPWHAVCRRHPGAPRRGDSASSPAGTGPVSPPPLHGLQSSSLRPTFSAYGAVVRGRVEAHDPCSRGVYQPRRWDAHRVCGTQHRCSSQGPMGNTATVGSPCLIMLYTCS